MIMKCDPDKVAKYLIDNELVDVYIFLITSADNLRNRANLLEIDLGSCRTQLEEILQRIEIDPKAFAPNNRATSELFKNLHYSVLEVIQRINILIELLAVYYRTIRENLKELPKRIGKGDITKRELFKEFEYFGSQKLSDIKNNFKYPDVAHFKELTEEERNTLRDLLNESAQTVLGFFRHIHEFQQRFRSVYNKYKHTLSELTGIFGVDYANRQIQTQVYVRHKEQNEYFTYLIPISFDDIKYLREIGAKTCELLRILIDSALYYLLNEKGVFLPKTLFIEKEKHQSYQSICDKIQSYVLPETSSKVIINPPTGKDAERINEALIQNHIYLMKKDIMNLEEIMKHGVTFSKDKDADQSKEGPYETNWT